MKWAILFLAGGIGTILRYVLSGCVYQWMGPRFPYGTLIVNLFGCFLIGFLSACAESKFFLSANARLFLMIGFLGAFTTFSTFIFETANLIKDGQIVFALANVGLSVGLGFAVFYLGILFAEFI